MRTGSRDKRPFPGSFLSAWQLVNKKQRQDDTALEVATNAYSIGTERMVKRVSPWDQNLEERWADGSCSRIKILILIL